MPSVSESRSRLTLGSSNPSLSNALQNSLDERAYIRNYQSETERVEELARWIHTYNHHRNHTAIGGPPFNRVANLQAQHT